MSEDRFFKGLFSVGGTENKEDYRYAGGNGDNPTENNSKSYYHLKFYEEKAPELFPWIDRSFPTDNHCVCGQYIKECCYVVNVVTKKTIIVGNSCIKNFMPEEYESKCFKCSKAVKNLRKDKGYICKDCRNQEELQQVELDEKVLKIIFENIEAKKKLKMEERSSWTFKAGTKTYTYKELVDNPENYPLVSWILKMFYKENSQYIKRYLIEYLETYLKHNEYFDII